MPDEILRQSVDNRLRYLFGCCSLTSRDERDGHRALALLRERGAVHPGLWLPVLPDFDCDEPAGTESGEGIALAPLFETYLRYGGKVCSPPAIDRRFKTIDFLVLLDVAALSPRARRMFFA